MDPAEAVTARRKSGADALLCPTCAAIVRGKAAVDPPQTRISQPEEAAKRPARNTSTEKKDGSKWYHMLGYSALALLFAGLVFYQLYQLETGAVDSVRLWLPVGLLYRTVGFWGAIGCPCSLALIFFGTAVVQLMRSRQDPAK